MIPLVLELDEELKEGEEMIGTRTIQLSAPPYSIIGYVAIIRSKFSGGLDYRYGNLRAYKYHEEKGNVL
jgi:hypothetical protein